MSGPGCTVIMYNLINKYTHTPHNDTYMHGNSFVHNMMFFSTNQIIEKTFQIRSYLRLSSSCKTVWDDEGVRSCRRRLLVPSMARSHLSGVLSVGDHRHSRTYSCRKTRRTVRVICRMTWTCSLGCGGRGLCCNPFLLLSV